MRYSIWATEHGSGHEVEVVQVGSNPQAIIDGLKKKTLTTYGADGKRVHVPKYTWLRIVDRGEPNATG